MLYRKLILWTDPITRKPWIAYSAENGRDISMGQTNERDAERSIVWAQSHGMEIEDTRRV